MSTRLIAKMLFLLVIIGFFMPMCCDMNGLQLADSGYVNSSGVFAIYAIFVSAIIGFFIGIFLLIKISVPVAIDWIVTVFNFLTTIIAFYVAGFVNGNKDYFQSGVYIILTGAILVMIVQIISAINDSGPNNEIQKSRTKRKCPFCANEIQKEAIICQFCGKDLPNVEIPENEKSNLVEGGKYVFIESDILRKGPGDHYPFVCRLKKDDIVERKQIDDDWSLVKKDNIEGWCLSSILKLKKE